MHKLIFELIEKTPKNKKPLLYTVIFFSVALTFLVCVIYFIWQSLPDNEKSMLLSINDKITLESINTLEKDNATIIQFILFNPHPNDKLIKKILIKSTIFTPHKSRVLVTEVNHMTTWSVDENEKTKEKTQETTIEVYSNIINVTVSNQGAIGYILKAQNKENSKSNSLWMPLNFTHSHDINGHLTQEVLLDTSIILKSGSISIVNIEIPIKFSGTLTHNYSSEKIKTEIDSIFKAPWLSIATQKNDKSLNNKITAYEPIKLTLYASIETSDGFSIKEKEISNPLYDNK